MILSIFDKLIPDIKEVVNLFSNVDDFDITHDLTEVDNTFNTVVTVSNTGDEQKQRYTYTDIFPKCDTDLEKKRYIKRYAKLSVYRALSSFTGKVMPWGALTGIRPTKLAYQEVAKTGGFEDFFLNTMKVSKDKTDLVKKILTAQKGIYNNSGNNTDFFVGIPFCPTRCRYCSFISTDIRATKALIPEYVDALQKEIKSSVHLIKNLRSIYIGGGTPVALSTLDLQKILKAIPNNGVEFTVEAGRPDCIDKDKLQLLSDYGVTRICVNPQTFNDKTLQRIGRYHTVDDVIEKFYLAKDNFNFDINMDLIAGLDDETVEDFYFSIDKAVSLSPQNITVHTLCLKKGSALKTEESRLSGNGVEKMVDYAHKVLSDNGYNPYYMYRQKYMAGNLENTGYAKVGKECVYNIDIMEEISDNVACGANSVSKALFSGGERIERYACPKDIRTYINKLPIIIEEKNKLFGKK